MPHLRLTLALDKDMLLKVKGYYIYRSQEEEGGRPVFDGLYIQRETINENPPEKMNLLLDWT